jgi:hypothetical protein
MVGADRSICIGMNLYFFRTSSQPSDDFRVVEENSSLSLWMQTLIAIHSASLCPLAWNHSPICSLAITDANEYNFSIVSFPKFPEHPPRT